MGLISYIFVILFLFHIQPIITSVYKLHLSVLVYCFSSRWFGLCFGFKVQEELKKVTRIVPETVSTELCLHVVEVELELSRWLIKV